MYKAAADSESFLKRVANHSITHSRRGDSSNLTNEPDVQYTLDSIARDLITSSQIEKQIEFAKFEKLELTQKLQKLNLKLAETLPLYEYKPLNKKREGVKRELADVEAHLGQLKAIRRELCQRHGAQLAHGRNTLSSFERVFIELARMSLPADLFNEIAVATRHVVNTLEVERKKAGLPRE